MLKRFNHIQDSILYSIAEALNHASGILILPVLLAYISLEEYGKITFLVLFLTLFRYLIGFAVKSSYLRLLYKNSEKENRKLTTVLISNISVAFLLFFVLLYFLLSTPNSLFEGIGNEYLLLCLITAYFYSIFEIGQSILRYKEKAIQYVLVNLSKVITEFLTLLTLFQFYSDGITIKFTATIISLILCILILVKNTYYKYFGVIYDFHLSKEFLKFSFPLILNGLLGWLMVSFDQYLIKSYFGFKELGILGVALQIIAIYKYSFEGILKGVNNLVFKKADIIKKYSKDLFTFFINLFVIGAVFILLLGEPLVKLIGTTDYQDSARVITYLIPGRLFMLLNTVLVFLSISQMKTKRILYSTIIASTSLISLSWFLIPRIGLLAIGVSSLSAAVLRFIILKRDLDDTISIYDRKQLLPFILFLLVFIAVFNNQIHGALNGIILVLCSALILIPSFSILKKHFL